MHERQENIYIYGRCRGTYCYKLTVESLESSVSIPPLPPHTHNSSLAPSSPSTNSLSKPTLPSLHRQTLQPNLTFVTSYPLLFSFPVPFPFSTDTRYSNSFSSLPHALSNLYWLACATIVVCRYVCELVCVSQAGSCVQDALDQATAW